MSQERQLPKGGSSTAPAKTAKLIRDEELVAMSTISRKLDALAPAVRQRVVVWLTCRYAPEEMSPLNPGESDPRD